MATSTPSKLDTARAKEIWEEYARTHDLTGQDRKAVGIDPSTGEVFLGSSAKEIIANLQKDGRFRPLFFRWVNDPYYFRRGHRRQPLKPREVESIETQASRVKPEIDVK